MTYIKKTIVLSLFIVSLTAGIVRAAVPSTINYQGMLTDNSGKALTGSYSFVFSLSSYSYTSGNIQPTGWSETQSGITVQNGLYSIQLGSLNNNPSNLALSSLPFDTTYYLIIQVGSEILGPPQPLGTTPYAFRSKYTDFAGSVNAASIGPGTLPNNVIASSVAVQSVGIPQIKAAGVASGSTYLDGSGNWSTPSGSGDMVKSVDGLAIANSTSSLQSQINLVIISTGYINTTLLSVQKSTYTMASINITTAQVTGSWAPNLVQAGNLPNTVVASSIAVNTVGITQINATGGAAAGKYLQGNGTWGTPSGSGDMTKAIDGFNIANSTASLQNQLSLVDISTTNINSVLLNVAASTTSLQNQMNSVGTSTGNINTTLLSVQRSTYTMLSISISTGQVTGNWYPGNMQSGNLPNNVIASSIAVNAVGIVQIKAGGVASGSTYLDGSGNWTSPSGSGDMTRALDGLNIANSTTSLQNQMNSVEVSTGNISTTLLAVQRSTYTMLSISISTGQVTGNWYPGNMQAGNLPNNVIASSVSVNAVGIVQIKAGGVASSSTYLDGSGNWTTPSGSGDMTRAVDGLNIANSTASLQGQINSIGISTGNINSGLISVGISTENINEALLSVQRSTYTMSSISITAPQVMSGVFGGSGGYVFPVGAPLTSASSATFTNTVSFLRNDVTCSNSATIPDVNIGNATFVRIIGPTGAFGISGFSGGSDGRLLIVYNSVPWPLTLNNEDVAYESIPANRITTLNAGATVTQGTYTFIYDGGSQRWVVTGWQH